MAKLYQEGDDISQKSTTYTVTGNSPTLWVTSNFAQDWYKDAVVESNRTGLGARRREILFSVCCAESYIVEWTRDLVGANRQLERYLPVDDKNSVLERWRTLPRSLHKNNLISQSPDWGTEIWRDFCLLYDYRNGLVHANVSRPYTGDDPNSQPTPDVSKLKALAPKWALLTITKLIRHLHAAIKTDAPDWLRH